MLDAGCRRCQYPAVILLTPVRPALRSRDGGEQFSVPEYQQIAQMDAFAKNILEDTPVVASGEEGLIDMRIVEAIRASIDNGRPVNVEI